MIVMKEARFRVHRDNLVPLYQAVIPSSTFEIDNVLEKVMHVVGSFPVANSEREELRLAVYEALANAMIHGNRCDPEKQVEVVCYLDPTTPQKLSIVIRDEGSGFDPNRVPDPLSSEGLYKSHGRGIHLMRKLVDEVAYFDGGREVELRIRTR